MNKLKYVIIAIAIVMVSGCSPSPQVVNMIPETQQYQYPSINKTIKIGLVQGGQETDHLIGGSKINNMSFLGALYQAMRNSNIFVDVDPEENPDLNLGVLIISQNQPFAGLNMTVSLIVRYTITDGADSTQIWQKDVFSKYTATIGCSTLMGSTRLNKANEGAVRENIRILLEEISKLDL